MSTIETKLGRISGRTERGATAFLGIPYAAAPVGELRWMPAVAAPAWSGTFDATLPPNRSLQPPYPEVLSGFSIPGEESEDCLYLNIYTPAIDGKKRPVMFWIHGGAYIQGAANEYDGTTLARENDVVVVAINYRLGIFGFFDLSRFGPEYAGSASLGFQDQIAALRWVREHIADYGGDPDSVTIWGESAGGGSVLALLGAPSAEGLFHRAVAFSPGEVTGPPVDNVTPLAARIGVEPHALLDRLRALSADELFAIQLEGAFMTTACLDGTIITRPAPEAIRARGSAGVPLIAGCTRDEGSFLAPVVDTAPGVLEVLTAVFAGSIGNGDPARYTTFLDELLPGATPLQRMERAWFDLFRSSALRAAQAATEAGVGGWVFNFDVPTENPLGAAHASDIPFTFNAFKDGVQTIAFHDGEDPAIRDLADAWSRTFGAFAHTGDPNGAGLPSWPRYAADARSCLVVGLPSRVVQDPDGAEPRAAYGLG
jgi:para-nitrobenzyl esterase